MNKKITEPTYMIEKLIRDNPDCVRVRDLDDLVTCYVEIDGGRTLQGVLQQCSNFFLPTYYYRFDDDSDFGYCNKHEAAYLIKVMRQVYKQHQKQQAQQKKKQEEQQKKKLRQEIIDRLEARFDTRDGGS